MRALKQYQHSERYQRRVDIISLGDHPEPLHEWFLRHYDLSSARQILEIGAGHGLFWQYAHSFLSAEQEVVLTDLSEGMLASAKKNIAALKPAAHFHYQTADAESLSFADASFDCVLSHLMLYHLSAPEKALHGFARVLRPAGHLGISVTSESTFQEIFSLASQLDHRILKRFNLKHADESFLDKQLPLYFADIKKYHYQSRLRITEPAQVVEVVRGSTHTHYLNLSEEFFIEFSQAVSEIIHAKGSFDTACYFTHYVCQK